MSRRDPAKKCSRCKNPMRRLYAKLPNSIGIKRLRGESRGPSAMKTVGWLCVEHRHTELDEVLG